MAHQYKLNKGTIADIQTMVEAANEFAGNVDAAQSLLSTDIEFQRDHLGERTDAFIDSERGQAIEQWLTNLETAQELLESLGELIGDLTEDIFPSAPES